MIIGDSIKIVSANVQGIQTEFKSKDVLNYLESICAHIICLQDVHLKQQEEDNLKIITKSDCFISGNRTNARGVAVIFRNNFPYNILNIIRHSDGNYIVIDFEICDISIRLINIYAPNNDSPQFFMEIITFIEENEQDYIINCGDFNLVLDPKID